MLTYHNNLIIIFIVLINHWDNDNYCTDHAIGSSFTNSFTIINFLIEFN